MHLATFLILSAVYIVPALTPWAACALIARIVYPNKSVFQVMDFVLLPLPFLAWVTLFMVDPFDNVSSKTLANGIAEPMGLGILYGSLSLWRFLVQRRSTTGNQYLSLIMPCVGVIFALLIFLGMPSLPE